MTNKKTAFVLSMLVWTLACSSPPEEAKITAPAEEELPPPVYESSLPEDMAPLVDTPFTGDMDGMLERRFIRAGVTFNRTFYFLDKGSPRGLAYEYLMLFEEHLNKSLKKGQLKTHVVLLPMPRDQLLPSLAAGKIDLVVAQLTVTPERQKVVDFSDPTRRNVNEVVVTAPGVMLASAADLSGKPVFVRQTSSYYESLQTLNRTLKEQGKPPVDIELASESLEDDDLLEMVNAGLIPATVVDGYIATFWKKVFPNMTVHDMVTLRTGGNLGVAFRKNSPLLAKAVNGFIAKYRLEAAVNQTINKRYLESTKYVKNATSDAERKKFLALVELFRKYGDKYKFDFLMMGAQGYQESRLDQSAKSHVGAIGVMQVMPATGADLKVGDINQLEPNIHAGVKYMRWVRDQYFESEPMDDLNKALFTFAAYNAGPNRILRLRKEAEKRGLDPNVWFGNVERIVSERIGRETVTYVSNIYKYYVAYKLVIEQNEKRKDAKATISTSAP